MCVTAINRHEARGETTRDSSFVLHERRDLYRLRGLCNSARWPVTLYLALYHHTYNSCPYFLLFFFFTCGLMHASSTPKTKISSFRFSPSSFLIRRLYFIIANEHTLFENLRPDKNEHSNSPRFRYKCNKLRIRYGSAISCCRRGV